MRFWLIHAMKCEDATVSNLFGLPFYNGSFDRAIECLVNDLKQITYTPKVVVTPNVDHIVRIYDDPQLYEVYKSANYFFADGFPVVLLSRFMSTRIHERVTGADIFPALCELSSNLHLKVFILGGHSTEPAYQTLKKLYPGADIRIYAPSMNFEYNGPEGQQAVRLVNSWQPDIVFCCLGMPKQELWALSHQQELSAKLILCVGAALDFVLGDAKRAPLLFQRIGMEWCWRLFHEPSRLWKRYLWGFFKFVKIVISEIGKHNESTK